MATPRYMPIAPRAMGLRQHVYGGSTTSRCVAMSGTGAPLPMVNWRSMDHRANSRLVRASRHPTTGLDGGGKMGVRSRPGAATVLEAAPEPRDVAALVSDSAFADLSSTLQGGLTRFTRLPGVLAVPAMQFARMYHVLPTLSPVDVVRSLPDRAFVFIHARGDMLIPVSNAIELDAASANSGERLLELDGADHLDTYDDDPARCLDAVLRFIDEQVAQHGLGRELHVEPTGRGGSTGGSGV